MDTPIHRARVILMPGNCQRFDPFLLMVEDYMKKGAFDYHPHRGMETVTYMIDGELHHKDNYGNSGILRKGDVQWMTAGKGILHLEESAENGFAHLLQIWINLPANRKMTAPRYQNILFDNIPTRMEKGIVYRVISGSSGNVMSSIENYVPITMVEINVKAGHIAKQDFKPDYNGFIHVLKGSGKFGSGKVEGSQEEVLWMTPSANHDNEISIEAIEDLKVLVVAGKPIREPVVAAGPFVMNTEQEIKQAFEDLELGRFGKWPQ
ncbi:MAG: pirin family protein [Bacteroidetes bacterium]|nr:MAG: pirin family protein [Bacteroidota bacterium]